MYLCSHLSIHFTAQSQPTPGLYVSISVFSSAVLILVLVLLTFSFSHSSITPKWMRSYSS